MQDTNAARSAVADRYMSQCAAVWIVSPIIRATNDKVAKDLLGNYFKTQLRFDGNYSNVTFICSKADEISVKETVESLDDDGLIEQLSDQEDKISMNLEAQKQALALARKREFSLQADIDKTDQAIASWTRLQKRAKKHGKVLLPAFLLGHGKRKHKGEPSGSQNKRAGVKKEASSDESSSDESSSDEETWATPDSIQAELWAREAESSKLAAEVELAGQEALSLEEDVKRLRAELKCIKNDRVACCIQMRNDYCRHVIPRDFVHGIRE